MKEAKNSIHPTARLGKHNLFLALYSLLFFLFMLIATVTAWGLGGESESFGEGLGKAIAIVFLLIFGGGCYGILGAVNGIYCLVYGWYLWRLAEGKPIRRAAHIASLAIKVLTALLTTGVGVFLSALLFSVPSALGFALAHSVTVAVIPVWLAALTVLEIHAYRKSTAAAKIEE